MLNAGTGCCAPGWEFLDLCPMLGPDVALLAGNCLPLYPPLGADIALLAGDYQVEVLFDFN